MTHDPEIPPVYCLSFDNTDRRKRMKERFEKLNIDVTFQEPVPFDSGLCDFYMRNHAEKNSVGGSALASFMTMFRSFLMTNKPYGVFCEDDVYIHKDFKTLIVNTLKVYESLRDKPRVLLLGYLINSHPGLPFYEEKKPILDSKGNQHFLYNYNHIQYIWGSQMMCFSKEAVIDMMEKYDRPVYLSCGLVEAYTTDWTITQYQPRALLYPMLGVEEGFVNSTHAGQLYFHSSCKEFNYKPDLYV